MRNLAEHTVNELKRSKENKASEGDQASNIHICAREARETREARKARDENTARQKEERERNSAQG